MVQHRSKKSTQLCIKCKWFELNCPEKIMDANWEGGYYYRGSCENKKILCSNESYFRRYTRYCNHYECKLPKFIQKLMKFDIST